MVRKYSFLCLLGIFVLANILLPGISFAQTHIREGEVSGDWVKVSSPYLIDGNISVAAGKKLIIQPGTMVLFNGPYSIVVRGTIFAKGKKEAPIAFSYTDSLNKKASAGWRGIKIQGSKGQKDTAQFTWCRFSYGNATADKVEKCRGGAIFADSCRLLNLSHCSFIHNTAVAGGAVYARNSTLVVEGCRFEQNRSLTDGGALCLVHCNLKLYNNTLLINQAYSLGGGLMIQGMKASMANNLVVENTARFGAGIALLNDTSTLTNNTIAENISSANGGGIHLEKSDTRFINTILWGNQTGKGGKQGYLFEGSKPQFWFCDIQEGTRRIGKFSSGSSSINGDYNNIESDPDFVRADSAIYSLSENSPCIDYGIPDTASLYLPKSDVVYKQRIHGRSIDMGAYEFGAAYNKNSETDEDNDILDENISLPVKVTLYPNPSQGQFDILVSNPEKKKLSLIRVNSSTGIELFQMQLAQNNEVFILPLTINTNPGICLLNITDEKGKIVAKKKVMIISK